MIDKTFHTKAGDIHIRLDKDGRKIYYRDQWNKKLWHLALDGATGWEEEAVCKTIVTIVERSRLRANGRERFWACLSTLGAALSIYTYYMARWVW